MIGRLGVEIKTGQAVSFIPAPQEGGKDVALDDLRRQFDAIVLAAGFGPTSRLGIEGEEAIVDGLKFIEASKTAPEKMTIGNNVLVIGAGNTAVDCATVARRLGARRLDAQRTTMVYRRSEREMTCYRHEYEFARVEGIEFRFLSQPARVLLRRGLPVGLECLRWNWARRTLRAAPRRGRWKARNSCWPRTRS